MLPAMPYAVVVTNPRADLLTHPAPRRRLALLKALGPITVCVVSIAVMNIFGLMNAPAKIKTVGDIPKGGCRPPFLQWMSILAWINAPAKIKTVGDAPKGESNPALPLLHAFLVRVFGWMTASAWMGAPAKIKTEGPQG
jgi:hypothetical protein